MRWRRNSTRPEPTRTSDVTSGYQFRLLDLSQHFGGLDVVINNASSFFATPIGSIDEAAWQALIGSNLKGPLFLSQAAAPYLKQ